MAYGWPLYGFCAVIRGALAGLTPLEVSLHEVINLLPIKRLFLIVQSLILSPRHCGAVGLLTGFNL